ncbi:MAG: flagellar motor switch protein [Methanoregulaceae archaeon PtaB.Bin108]|nr:MAG: flagellar motor switch protein [Methanoregulaceae archaeon PtaB.Bin108]OPY45243.1 MAG: flagellar motor switch protein [Methanoregulaceae archaeon PtaU1.Bin222]
MKFNPVQMDAMQELTNIGASHAATTLSQMLACNIDISVPEVKIVDISDVGMILGDEVTTMVLFQLQGDIPAGGFLILHFSNESALRTASIMCGVSDEVRPLGEMDQSALLEVGNIMMSAFLGSTSSLLGIMMLPSPPFLVIDIGHAVLQSLIAQMGMDVDDVIIFKVTLASSENRIAGNIFIFLDDATLTKIATLLEAMLNSQPSPV